MGGFLGMFSTSISSYFSLQLNIHDVTAFFRFFKNRVIGDFAVSKGCCLCILMIQLILFPLIEVYNITWLTESINCF